MSAVPGVGPMAIPAVAGVSEQRLRPLAFNATSINEMLAAGSEVSPPKTQTRRVIRGVFKNSIEGCAEDVDCVTDVDGLPSRLDWAPSNWEVCPYGMPGDILWVRETWAVAEMFDDLRPSQLLSEGLRPHNNVFWYKAITDRLEGDDIRAGTGIRGRWRSPRFMPRWATRILLRVESTRAQRLQDITNDDAIAEGANVATVSGILGVPWSSLADPRTAFAAMWDHVNAARGYSWESDPWVWAIRFSVHAVRRQNREGWDIR